jgi:hypothetical protein
MFIFINRAENISLPRDIQDLVLQSIKAHTISLNYPFNAQIMENSSHDEYDEGPV